MCVGGGGGGYMYTDSCIKICVPPTWVKCSIKFLLLFFDSGLTCTVKHFEVLKANNSEIIFTFQQTVYNLYLLSRW